MSLKIKQSKKYIIYCSIYNDCHYEIKKNYYDIYHNWRYKNIYYNVFIIFLFKDTKNYGE